jgi:hypothetical protein
VPVTVTGDAAVARVPDSLAAGAARPIASPEPARPAHVSATINARPADSLLRRASTIASRVALWALLAAVVFALQLQLSSALRRYRRKQARLS